MRRFKYVVRRPVVTIALLFLKCMSYVIVLCGVTYELRHLKVNFLA